MTIRAGLVVDGAEMVAANLTEVAQMVAQAQAPRLGRAASNE